MTSAAMDRKLVEVTESEDGFLMVWLVLLGLSVSHLPKQKGRNG